MTEKNLLKISLLKKQNKKIGLVHGVFDVLHIGHLAHFEEAKKHVDYLIASVTDDKYVNKAPGKPFFTIEHRIKMLSNLKVIDLVIKSSEKTALTNIEKIKPNLYFKGIEYKNKDITGNILKEIKLVKKLGGNIFYTNNIVFSSSKILNEQFNFITSEAREFFKKINLKKLKDKIENFKKINKKIIVLGDQIIDKYKYIKSSGKSNKSLVISTQSMYEKHYGGGTILVANFLENFFYDISFFYPFNRNNNKLIKKFLKKSIKKISFSSSVKFIEKTKFIEEYTGTKLFQNTENENNYLYKKEIQEMEKKFKKLSHIYEYFFLYDFGYYSVPKNLIDIANKSAKKFFINCQSNSYNFGYNIATKYQKGFVLAMDEQEYRLCVQDKRTELKELIKKNIKHFKNISELVVTNGKYGCYIVKKNKIISVPSILQNLRDTTGCGDIFLAMYGVLSISNKFSTVEKAILSHIAAGLHGSSMGNDNKINLTNFIKTCANTLN
jgi:cytidyltransferase-like protein